ncbi:heme/hemin ABC transporter substrate-binding protein [Atopomonas sediminilitoris]|uniref:heme/hemin ABC transporter substrate-binding protein n=1 Tax=Atopomonas sediminilitoris TaxID=2919919 RepID=UPI001F4ED017|nr:ABC transporter substrate-binding protein [Atopomonas sediminilitoris]MCJ8168109.1 ABC transporter substrate-binding protein [Atopomonas sediminilitoris]
MRRKGLALRCVAAVLLSQACLSGGAIAADMRLISAGGAVSEWLVALGAADKVVAVDSTSRHPAFLTQLPNVGYQRSLSAEGILALHPDALIGTEEMGPPPVLKQLDGAGVALHRLSAEASLAAVQANLRKLGDVLNAPEQAAQRYRAFYHELTQVTAALQPIAQAKPRVLLLLSHAGGNPMVAGRESAGDWLINLAGGRNVATHQGYQAMTSEALLALAPEVIVVTDRALQGDEARRALLQQQPALAVTPAAQAQRLPFLDPTLLVGGVSPRVPAAVAQLAQAFYPALKLPSSLLAGHAP